MNRRVKQHTKIKAKGRPTADSVVSSISVFILGSICGGLIAYYVASVQLKEDFKQEILDIIPSIEINSEVYGANNPSKNTQASIDYEFYTVLPEIKPVVAITIAANKAAGQVTEAERAMAALSGQVIPKAKTNKIDANQNQANSQNEDVVSMQVNNVKIANIESTANIKQNTAKNYVLQLASFKNLQEAQLLNSELVMQNFESSIEATKVNGQTFYRVLIGPFSNQNNANAARSRLNASGFRGANIVYR